LLKQARRLEKDNHYNLEPEFAYLRVASTIVNKKCKAAKPEDFLNLN